MIVTCEKCNKRYLVKDEEIGTEGRKVRCVSCDHTWIQAAVETLIPLKIDPQDIPDHPKAINESASSRLPKSWVFFCLSILVLFGTLYFGRHMIISNWSYVAPLYEALGFEVVIPGKGLKVENVQPQHMEEEGKTSLVVKGEVVNTSEVAQVIPPIHIQLMGVCKDDSSKMCVVKEWQHAFSESRLLPGERIQFETEPQITVADAKNIRVKF